VLRWLSLFAFLACAARAAEPPVAAELLSRADRDKTSGDWEPAAGLYAEAAVAAGRAGDDATRLAALLGFAESNLLLEVSAQAAERPLVEALSTAERIGDEARQADALKLAGNLFYGRGDHFGSRAAAELVLAMREKLDDRAGIAVALNNYGNTLAFVDPLGGIGFLERAQCELHALGDDRRRSTVVNNIGLAYQDLGDYAAAQHWSEMALRLAEQNSDSRRAAVALNALGVTETFRGNYRSALAFYDRSLTMQRDTKHLWGEAEVLNNIGLVYQAQGNHAQAISFFSRSLELDRKVGDSSLDAECSMNLAKESLALGRLADAEGQFAHSIALSRKNAKPAMLSEALTGLAHLHAQRGRRRQALSELDEALRAAREVSGRRLEGQTLTETAFLQLSAGRARDALSSAREAVATCAAVGDADTLWQAHLAESKALRALERRREASAELDASISTIESQRRRVTGTPGSLPLYFADRLAPYRDRIALSLAAGDTETALLTVDRSKSRVLFDLLRAGRLRLDGSLTTGELRKERGLENELASLNLGLEKEPQDEALRSRREEKRRELEAYQTELDAAHPELALQRGAAPLLSKTERSRLLADESAVLLDYFVTPMKTYLFVVTPSETRAVTLPITRRELARKTAELRRQLASHDLGFAPLARELYDLLLAPAERERRAVGALIVVPDGPLREVPFQALRTAGGRFVVEETAVSYAPSLAVLAETRRIARLRASSPARKELLALGNAGGTPLPEAERQVREIASVYAAPAEDVLVGPAASEARFKARAGGYRVLHLASHGVLEDASPMYSHVLLAAGDGEDGLLEARELTELRLNAELLVLSGCETARGVAADGEGLTGMLWAAFAAGAPTTIASLWRVESASTSDLMIEFHRRVIAERSEHRPFAKAEALRAGARRLLALGKYAHPYYWAGFILAGSPD
jgi:CHAT domain-containing protein